MSTQNDAFEQWQYAAGTHWNSQPKSDGYEGACVGDMTLCRVCNHAIQLIRSRTPETLVDHDFWVHYQPLVVADVIETHKAVPKRCWYPEDWDRYYATNLT